MTAATAAGRRPGRPRLAVVAAAVALALGGLAPACSCDGEELAPPPTFDQCTSTPASFVRDASLALLGHRPRSQREVDAYVALYDQVAAARAAGASTDEPRAVVARALLARPERIDRWTGHFLDALRVARIEDQSQADCYGSAALPAVGPDLARAVRDTPSTGPGTGAGFTMLDLARSAIALGDLTPLYRGHLFALVARPITAANVPPVEAELARRDDSGGTFDGAYLGRDLVCLGCHNSDASVTDDPDPALDRHWPVAGRVDRAVFGDATGLPAARAHAAFRVDGFVRETGGRTPWGMSARCGRFADPATLPPDPAAVDGRLASLTGDRLTVHDLDAALRRGFDTLRLGGLVVAADGTVADPDAAMAYLVATTIVEGVWREVVGAPLTIATHFPRNQAARDQLQRLTDDFIAHGYALEPLLIAIVSSPYFSRLPPEAGCGATPYDYPAVYDPWTRADADPARHGNGAGDAIAGLSARALLAATQAALEWPPPGSEAFPHDDTRCVTLSCNQLAQQCAFDSCCETLAVQCRGLPPTTNVDERPFQRAVGVFLKNGERGFRGLDFQARLAWEDRFGACAKPRFVTADDFLDRAVALGHATAGATVADVVAVIKDRLVGEPVAADGEAEAIAAVLGVPLTGPAATLDVASARRLCGALLASPQFLLTGVAARGGPPPTLVLPGDGFDEACARIADAALVGWAVTCGPGSLTATTAP